MNTLKTKILKFSKSDRTFFTEEPVFICHDRTAKRDIKIRGTYFLTSESVGNGHPDKVCDQISDAVLDAILKDDPKGRVACETFISAGLVIVGGEITTKTYVDVHKVVRQVLVDIGYTDQKY